MAEMATEAQKLIGLSLTKIAQSRMNRGGISLHKNLLVATVLQKARFIFMEEAYAASYAGEMVPAPLRPPYEPPAEPRPQPAPHERVAKRRRDAPHESEPQSASAKRRCGDESLQHVSRFEDRLQAPRDYVERLEDSEEPMEVDKITSLVSVFSFGASTAPEPLARLSRSVSTPDLCSAQAKELDSLQRRTAVAMAV